MTEIAIVGAGPYGLSIAAHLRGQGIPFRIFGRPMESWLLHMPKTMSLKSDGFASNISDPNGELTLEKFCVERGLEYAAMQMPVRLDTFTQYGLTFRERLVPELEEKFVTHIERANDGFRLRLEDGEELTARRVILAIGITHYAWTPEVLATLPSEYVSHSFRHMETAKFNGKSVIVVGGGSSATDLAAELHEAGAKVQLIARQKEMNFHSAPQIGKSARSGSGFVIRSQASVRACARRRSALSRRCSVFCLRRFAWKSCAVTLVLRVRGSRKSASLAKSKSSSAPRSSAPK